MTFGELKDVVAELQAGNVQDDDMVISESTPNWTLSWWLQTEIIKARKIATEGAGK